MKKSNPTATPGCQDRGCLGCRNERGKGGQCRRGNIQYQVGCLTCPDDKKDVYIGETSRNLFTRGKEHDRKFLSNNEDSFMIKHQLQHPGQPANFAAKVTGSFSDCLTRQVSEGVSIRRCPHAVMNSKSEWHQPALWRVTSQLERE